MPFDPAAGFPLDPDAALRGRVLELERRLDANPGAQAGGGYDPSTLQIPYTGLTLAQLQAQNGPKVTLTIPEPGAFVQFYAEVDAALRSVQGGLPAANYLWAEVQVLDDVYMSGDTNDGIAGNPGHFATQVSLIPDPSGGAFRRVRQSGQRVDDVTKSYGVQTVGAGVLGTQWAKPGQRTIYLAVMLGGQGVTSNAGTVAEFRGRRLMARAVQ